MLSAESDENDAGNHEGSTDETFQRVNFIKKYFTCQNIKDHAQSFDGDEIHRRHQRKSDVVEHYSQRLTYSKSKYVRTFPF